MMDNFKPFAPTQQDTIQAGDTVRIKRGTPVTRYDARGNRSVKPLGRDLVVKVHNAGWGDVSWGERRANRGSCDANLVDVVEYQHGEPTVSFRYLADILPLTESRYVAWHMDGVGGRPALGLDLRYINSPYSHDRIDSHSTRLPLDSAETLYNRIRDYREQRRVEFEESVKRHGPLGAMVQAMLR
jgi:hypothetical protein